MIFSRTRLAGPCLIKSKPVCDNRGYFARIFCEDEFAANGLEVRFPQHSVSYSAVKGTLRGLHYQREPYGEVKVVRCLQGAIWDVIIDIRPESPTYGEWEKFELSSSSGDQLYVPSGFAHGFQTLCSEVFVSYLITVRHVPDAASGVRYDDPAFSIEWPLPVSEISGKDRQWPDFSLQQKRRPGGWTLD